MPSRQSVLSLVVVLLTLTGCGSEQEAATEPNGELAPDIKVFKSSMDGAPSTIDPVQASNIYANAVVVNAYDTLYRFKYLARPYEVTNNLAAGPPEISADGLVYRIRIKEGVHFIDDPAFDGGVGREVVAEDFVYSLKRQFDTTQRPRGAWLWQGRIVGIDDWKEAGSDYDETVEGLRAVDRYTIEIRLVKPYPQLIYTLTMGYAAIVPREAVETYGREFGSHPVGSGPFRVVSYDSARIVYEKNPKFRQEPVDIWEEGYDPETQAYTGVEAIQDRAPPFIDRLEIHFISENAARWNSFTKGNEIQYVMVPNEQVDRVLASKRPIIARPEISERYFIHHGVESGFVFMSFNMDFPEFGYNEDPERERRNKALRCAITKGFDWERRNESFYFGLGEVFPGVIPPAVPEFDPDMSRASVTLDIDGAKQLLADNGWNEENLPEIVYGAQAGVNQRMLFEQFRGFLKKIGYPPKKIVLKQYATFGDFVKDTSRSLLPMIFKGWGLDFPDAENTLQLFYGPNESPGSNDANYKNAEFDRLYEQSAVMLPSPERTAIYQRMNRMLIDDCVTITGLARTRVYLWHRDVIAMPDREIVSGFFLRFVDTAEDGELSMDVLKFAMRKLVGGIPLILGVTFVSFLLMVYFGPDMTFEMLGKNPTPEQIAEVRTELGYDRPFLVRYTEYLQELTTLEFGLSDSTGEPVIEMLGRSIPISLALVTPGFILGNLLGVLLALVAAYHRSGWVDKAIMGFSVVGMSISFLIVIIAFQILLSSSYGLNLFPVRGWNVHSFYDYVMYVTVPTLASVFVALGYNTRFYRAVIVEEMTRDHVRTARAFGISPRKLLYKHILKNAAIPIITRVMFSIPLVIVSGSLLIESYFGIPGVGKVTFDAITSGDQPVLKAVVGLTAVLFVITLLITDILYRAVDPRVSLK